MQAQNKTFTEKLDETARLIYKNPDIKVSDLAGQMATSERQLFRRIRDSINMTPAEYLKRFRLERAKKKLEKGQSATFATYDSGFTSQSHFSKCFKIRFGLSPSAYKKDFLCKVAVGQFQAV